MSVAVLVPWRAGCPHREAAWRYVSARLAALGHPIHVGELDPDAPWCKADAVRRALDQTDATTVVLHDADVDVDHAAITECIDAVEARRATWAIPHRYVHRLEPDETEALYGGAEPFLKQSRRYTGQPCGGVLVVERATYDAIPLDPRFVGWGGEDLGLEQAYLTLRGQPLRLAADLIHLWHPGGGRQRQRVPAEAAALYQRYLQAARATDPRLMWQIVEEVTPCSTSPRS